MSETVLTCGALNSVQWDRHTNKLYDGNLHTCLNVDGQMDPFIYLWMYTGELRGSLHVRVIGNYTCWPGTALRVMRVTSHGHVKQCSARIEENVGVENYKACPHHCWCPKCDGYVVLQLPSSNDTMKPSLSVCEISLAQP